ncbi:MAG: hypothetical protein AAGA00_01715 [Pseudomonadota bacterium]
MKARQACADDLAAVRRLLRDTWHATYGATMGVEAVDDITSRWHSLDNLGRQLGHRDGLFQVADYPVGVIVGHARATPQSQDAVCLSRLHVLPDLEGGGDPAAAEAMVMMRHLS